MTRWPGGCSRCCSPHQAAAIALVAIGTTFGVWAAAQLLLGVGTALVYPTLLAGAVASAWGVTAAIWVVAALTVASGLLTAVRMYETHPRR